MDERPQYWFRAKRFGWGWGLPLTWQGWLVLVCYIALMASGLTFLGRHPVGFIAYGLLLTSILTAICYAKGEPPKWRWGRRL